jgi:hypothetical protein
VTLLNKIVSADKKYGTSKVVETIEYSLANNYQGIVFDRLESAPVKASQSRSNGDNVFLQIAQEEGIL